jgi:ubiquitin-activating enzyme E1
MDREKPTIDHNLYSRQIGAFGVETMGRLVQLKVLLIGLRGPGIEAAKNLILAGPKQVVLYDDEKVQIRDLGVNFYCKEEHVGKVSRSEASLPSLKELNQYVDVSTHSGEIKDSDIHHFDVVVVTDNFDRDFLIRINKACRNSGKHIGFMAAGLIGLYGYTFVDFGDNFVVFDPNGEETRSVIVSHISNDNPMVVTTHEDKRHGFLDGDSVRFKEIQGMTEVNGQTYEIKVLSPHNFTINCDGTNFNKYVRNGLAEQIKVPQTIHFKSFEDSLNAPLGKGFPSLENPDLEKWGRPEHLHLGLNALFEFQRVHKRLPQAGNQAEADEVANSYEQLNSSSLDVEGRVKVDEIKKDLIVNMVRFHDAQTSCHAAFWGGIIAQEIIKFTGKFMPIRQWLHYENYELIPEGEVNRKTTGCRYDDMITIFGQEFQEKLMNQNYFLVGAGALGCEFIKQFALTGMCCGTKGKLTCTDDDNIEISNLNRQFLFRKDDVGKSKSESACRVGLQMNKDLRVQALKLRVSPENEAVFNDDFWEGLDGVTNAVDNVKARLFVDGRCVFYGRPLFESGTLGTKCNSQVILPHKTQSYGDSQDPAEESIPLCTLKNFPYQIEHTIQWGRDFFEGIFVDGPNEYQKYSEDPNGYIEMLKKEFKQQQNVIRSRLETVNKISNYLDSATHESCIKLARDIFQDTFYNMIASLLHTFPADHKTEAGQLFWSGLKRLPQAIEFDPKDNTHVEFVFATANLFAFVFKLDPITDKNWAAKTASEIKVNQYNPKKVVVKENEKDVKEEKAEDDEVVIEELSQLLSSKESQGESNVLGSKISARKSINTIEFEKDDDNNHHIDFIAAVANLRARNYTIQEVERHKIKMIAGKIIPAIATATAMIVGVVGFEILKYVMGKDIGVFRNAFCNLAIPMWVFSEPLPPIKNKDKDYDPILMCAVKAIPSGWTNWDRIDVQGPKTLNDIFAEVKSRYGVQLSMVTIGDTMIYTSGMSPKERLTYTPEQAFLKIKGFELNQLRRYIELTASGETDDGIDAMIPSIRYKRN